MEAQTYWNEVGSQKDFEDPLYLEKIKPYIHHHSKIVEYGCGYGRLLQFLKSEGYTNLYGFDFAPKMIERGKSAHPDLNLTCIKESGKVPLEDEACDLVILSTILCCTVAKEEQTKIVKEMQRILKPGGVLYLSDFMITDHPRYTDKYKKGFEDFQERGIYTTSEGIAVRHHTTQWIMKLLENFSIQWFEQFDFKTMNQNFARTCHCVAQK
ncbi:MAG: class I SAM-dependent methyltransferase [Candidatus Algichlamydia australiensis]|nr:class I SAM-dependent methyltransferase [Chlamydiales bacterium]